MKSLELHWKKVLFQSLSDTEIIGRERGKGFFPPTKNLGTYKDSKERKGKRVPLMSLCNKLIELLALLEYVKGQFLRL